MIYGYARVSTAGQAKDGSSLDSQMARLKESGAELIYKESYTGTKADRPQFNKLLGTIKEGDTLIVSKLDRFARSAYQGAELIKTLQEKGVVINILNMGKLDNTPSGRLITQIFLAFAEFERDMIVERTQEGKAIAKMDPNYSEGRPPKFTEKQIQHAISLKSSMSYKQVTELTGVSKSTLTRAMRK